MQSFKDLPNEMLSSIFLCLNLDEFIHVSPTNTSLNTFIKKDAFWEKKVHQHFSKEDHLLEKHKAVSWFNFFAQNYEQAYTGLPLASKHLLTAIKEGNTHLLNQIAADLNIRDVQGRTALHTAAQYGKIECFQQLLTLDANPETRTLGYRESNHSPLHEDMTLVHIASKYNQGNFIRALKHVGLEAMIHTTTSDGERPLDFAAQHGSLDALLALAELGANLHDANAHGMTPGYIAVVHGQIHILKELVRQGFDLKARVNEQAFSMILACPGMTLVHLAAACDQIEMLHYLHESKLDLNALDIYGFSPAHYAVANLKTRSLETLASLGADLNLKSHVNSHVQFSDMTPIHFAAAWGYSMFSQLITPLKAYVNVKNTHGLTPLHYAAQIGYLPHIKILVDLGADVHARSKNGETPLHSALRSDNLDAHVIEALVMEMGIPVNARTLDGRTALHLAAEKYSTKGIEKLVSLRASLDAQTLEGKTPFHVAAEGGHVNAMYKLVELGCNPYLKTGDQRLVFELAPNTLHRSEAFLLCLNYAAMKGMDKHLYILLSQYKKEYAQVRSFQKKINTPDFVQDDDMTEPMFMPILSHDKTPAHIAAQYGQVAILRLLAKFRINLNSTLSNEHDAMTPAHLAAMHGQIESLQTLAQLKVDLHQRTNKGYTPADIASQHQQTHVIEALESIEKASQTTLEAPSPRFFVGEPVDRTMNTTSTAEACTTTHP